MAILRELLTVEEVHKIIPFERSQIRDFIDDGKLRAHEYGGVLMVHKDDLKDFCDNEEILPDNY